MKKTGWLLLAAVLLAGCDTASTSSSGAARPDVGGTYDVTLLPALGPVSLYTVAVEQGGGSGAAMVSITGPSIADTVAVTAGASVDLGTCGLWMVFGNIPGFNLAAGDNWRINVVEGFPGQPIAGDSVASTVAYVAAGGLDTCVAAPCDGSVLASAVPPGAGPPGGAGRGWAGGQWLSVRLSQTGANLAAVVPEEHVLSLDLGDVIVPTTTFLLPALVAPGDTVTITFRRRIVADGQNGDFFRAVAVNGAQSLDAQYLFGASVNSGDTVVSLTYTSLSPFARLDFIVGLSDQGEEFILDNVMVSTVSGGVKLVEDFEAGPGGSCGPAGINAELWSVRDPAWSVGGMCVSAQDALAGNYSAVWRGGSYRRLTGSVLIGGSSSSTLSELLGGGGSLADAIPGIFMEAWEPVWSGYFTSFAAAAQSPGMLAGTFRGESQNHDCVEHGELTATVHHQFETDLSSRYWVMRIQGQAINCTPALLVGNTIAFGDTLSTPAGDTISMLQIGQILAGVDTPIDDYGNVYGIGGLVAGTLVTLNLNNPLLGASAAGIGVVGADMIQGALAGSLAFDAGRVCDLAGGSTFTVRLVDK
ncbi:MAG TPA: hypothetical protein VM658_17100 [bacterium]|nr:hypothetical protein [bacterium]